MLIYFENKKYYRLLCYIWLLNQDLEPDINAPKQVESSEKQVKRSYD